MENYFYPEEIEPCKQACDQLVDDLANRLYKAGKIKSKINTYACLFCDLHNLCSTCLDQFLPELVVIFPDYDILTLLVTFSIFHKKIDHQNFVFFNSMHIIITYPLSDISGKSLENRIPDRFFQITIKN